MGQLLAISKQPSQELGMGVLGRRSERGPNSIHYNSHAGDAVLSSVLPRALVTSELKADNTINPTSHNRHTAGYSNSLSRSYGYTHNPSTMLCFPCGV